MSLIYIHKPTGVFPVQIQRVCSPCAHRDVMPQVGCSSSSRIICVVCMVHVSTWDQRLWPGGRLPHTGSKMLLKSSKSTLLHRLLFRCGLKSIMGGVTAARGQQETNHRPAGDSLTTGDTVCSCTIRLELQEVLEVKKFQKVQERGERLPTEHRPLLSRAVGVQNDWLTLSRVSWVLGTVMSSCRFRG